METIYESNEGKIIHGDNLEVMKTLSNESIDSCISDFPYFIKFMKQWDKVDDIYYWCYPRAVELLRIMKHGGYACIFGHPKTNHRMKCAFEDAGFNIVEEIAWIQCTGLPKSQSIGKLFDKSLGIERPIIDIDQSKQRPNASKTRTKDNAVYKSGLKGNGGFITEPQSDMAKRYEGYRTSGLKPSHESITIFQKPLEGTYIQNIEKHGCGAMNIDACRVPISQIDIDAINKKASTSKNNNYSEEDYAIYGKYKSSASKPANPVGRFPPNTIFDEIMANELDLQTGITKSSGGQTNNCFNSSSDIFGTSEDNIKKENGGYGDKGGMSKMFPIFKYCPKVSPTERKLPDGTRNPHVTVKPKELIKWLIKLVTPIEGTTIDITAGSCTSAIACEELNKNKEYNLKWINIELMNSEEEPYCKIGRQRIESLFNN